MEILLLIFFISFFMFLNFRLSTWECSSLMSAHFKHV